MPGDARRTKLLRLAGKPCGALLVGKGVMVKIVRSGKLKVKRNCSRVGPLRWKRSRRKPERRATEKSRPGWRGSGTRSSNALLKSVPGEKLTSPERVQLELNSTGSVFPNCPCTNSDGLLSSG